jgi:hypothetical protein
LGEDYCWKKLVHEDSKIPSEFDEDTLPLSDINQIIQRVEDTLSKEYSNDMTNTVGKLPTLDNLTEAPAKFILTMALVLRDLELKCATCEDDSQMPRKFTLLPFPNFKWRYVTMNDRALASNTGQSKGSSYPENLKLFHNVFDFSKFGFNR